VKAPQIGGMTLASPATEELRHEKSWTFEADDETFGAQFQSACKRSRYQLSGAR